MVRGCGLIQFRLLISCQVQGSLETADLNCPAQLSHFHTSFTSETRRTTGGNAANAVSLCHHYKEINSDFGVMKLVHR